MQIRHPTQPDQSCSCKSGKQFQPDHCWSGESAFQTWSDKAQSEQAYQNSWSCSHKVHSVESREQTVDRLPKYCTHSTTINTKQTFIGTNIFVSFPRVHGIMGHKRSQRNLYSEQLVQSKQQHQWTRRVHTSGQCTGNWTNTFHSEEPFLGTGLIQAASGHCFVLNTSRSHSLLECVGTVQSAVEWTVINSTWLHVNDKWGFFNCCRLFSYRYQLRSEREYIEHLKTLLRARNDLHPEKSSYQTM